jgi:hypothetical protein
MTTLYGERSAQLDKLFEALSNFHGDITNVERNRTGEFGQYADLGNCWDAVRKAMQANGLGLAQPIVPYGSDGTLAVVSHLGHSSGQYIVSAIPLTPGVSMQVLASEITYARRIAMASLLGLAPDWDDDGKQAKKNFELHQYANDTDKKWSEKAKKAIKDAIENEDGERLTAIEQMITDAVRDGKISKASKEMLDHFATQVGEEVVNAQ